MPEPSQMTLLLFKASTFLCTGLVPFPSGYKASSEENGPHLSAEMVRPSDPNHSQCPSSQQPHSPSQNLTSLQSLRPRPDPTHRFSPTNQPYTNPSPQSTSHLVEGWTTAFPSIPTQQQTPFQPFLQSLPLSNSLPISTNNTNEIPSCSPFELPMSPLRLDVLESTFDVLESGLGPESPSKLPSPLSTRDILKTLSSGHNGSQFQYSESSPTCDGFMTSLVPGNQSVPIENPSNTIDNGSYSSSPLQPPRTPPTSDLIKKAWKLASAQRSPSRRSPTSQQYETLSYFDNSEASISSSSLATPSLSCPMEFQQVTSNPWEKCKLDFKRCIRAHMKLNHNPAGEVLYSCLECTSKFGHLKDLTTHIKQEHNDAAVRYNCPHCQTKFLTKQSLNGHVRAQHEGKRYSCSQCDCEYKYPSDLKKHMKEKHSGEAVLYDCPHCHKKFPTERRLKLHITAVQKNVLYHCLQCECKYPHLSSLAKHVKQKHTPGGNAPSIDRAIHL